jgi:hypothetical protein
MASNGFVLVVPVSTRMTASIIPISEPLHPRNFLLQKFAKSAFSEVEMHTSGDPQLGFNARAHHLAKALQCHAFGKEYACHTIVVTGGGLKPLSLEAARLLQKYANQKYWKE